MLGDDVDGMAADRLALIKKTLPRSPEVVDRVIELMGDAYPELRESRSFLMEVAKHEEEGFRRTLEQGTKLLDDLLDAGAVGAADAFKLHDTFGFPIELTREMAAERGVPFEQDTEFERLMGEQRARSSAAAKGGKVGREEETVRALGSEPAAFVGYEDLEVHTVVQGVTTEITGNCGMSPAPAQNDETETST